MKKFVQVLFFFFMATVNIQAISNTMLPVKNIILSSSGLAKFEHQGEINDDAEISLTVQFDQVDDILKSLVVLDRSGQLGGVSLPGRAPLSQFFRDLPFSRHELNSPMTLLNTLQGAHVTVAGPTQIRGKIIQVVPEDISFDDGQKMIRQHRLTIFDKNGLRQTVLEDMSAVRFDDAKLQMQIDQALEAVFANAARDRRTLTIDLRGEGKRTVTMAYVVAAPLWKAAYRLMVPDVSKKSGLIQGWAVVENMTGQDWDDVTLTLVSGNPVTYRQPLYQSYFVDRPLTPVEVPGRILPRQDTGMFALSKMEVDQQTDGQEYLQHSKAKHQSPRTMGRSGQDATNRDQVEQIAAHVASTNAPSMPAEGGDAIAQIISAIGQEATAQVLFHFSDVFDLPAGDSLMLPFVSRELSVERLWLYQPETHSSHPLAALHIKNDGETGLPPGIVTLYDDSKDDSVGQYVGDAKLPMLPKGEDRLISFALDTKTLIEDKVKNTTQQGVVTISDGVVRTTTKHRMSTKYNIKAPAEENRIIVLEHQRQPKYQLIRPDSGDVEMTSTHFRVRVPLKAGETKTTTVVLERVGFQSMNIIDLSVQQLEAYTNASGQFEPLVREQFEHMREKRQAVDRLEVKLRELANERQAIFADQKRIRENLRTVPNDSDIGQRYLNSLNNQENRIEEIGVRQTELETEKNKQLRKLKDIIATMRV